MENPSVNPDEVTAGRHLHLNQKGDHPKRHFETVGRLDDP